ncbi:MAG: OmpH family outer membrane protein [Dysgonamonadaceae bacterium]
MLKKLFILFFAIAPLCAFAQEMKVAYINTNEIFSAMPELKDVETKMTAKQEEIKKALADIEAEYNKKVEEFKASKVEITPALTTDRQKQLEQLQDRYQAYAQTSDTEFQQLRQSLLAPVQQKLQTAIKAVGDEQGFTYILEVGALPYVSTKAVNAGPLVKAKLGIK